MRISDIWRGEPISVPLTRLNSHPARPGSMLFWMSQWSNIGAGLCPNFFGSSHLELRVPETLLFAPSDPSLTDLCSYGHQLR